MKNFVSGKNDFAKPVPFDIEELHDRNDVGTWEWAWYSWVSKESASPLVRCSECKEIQPYPYWYCPECGAMMINRKSMQELVGAQVDAQTKRRQKLLRR